MKLKTVGLLALAVLMLSACATTEPEPSTPPPAASPTPTPEPTTAPVEDGITAVTMSGVGISLVNADGTPALDFGWKDEPDLLLPALDEAFGFAATETTVESNSFHEPDYIEHRWEGFSLLIAIIDREAKPDYYLLDLARVHTTTDVVGGVAIQSESGAHVGQTVEEIAQFAPLEQSLYEGARQLLVDPEFPERTDPAQPEGTEMVALFVAPGQEVATEMFAPVLSHGGL